MCLQPLVRSTHLPIWLVLDHLMKKCLPSSDQLTSCLVGWNLGSKLQFLSKFAEVSLKHHWVPGPCCSSPVQKKNRYMQDYPHVTRRLISIESSKQTFKTALDIEPWKSKVPVTYASDLNASTTRAKALHQTQSTLVHRLHTPPPPIMYLIVKLMLEPMPSPPKPTSAHSVVCIHV